MVSELAPQKELIDILKMFSNVIVMAMVVIIVVVVIVVRIVVVIVIIAHGNVTTPEVVDDVMLIIVIVFLFISNFHLSFESRDSKTCEQNTAQDKNSFTPVLKINLFGGPLTWKFRKSRNVEVLDELALYVQLCNANRRRSDVTLVAAEL